MTLPPPDRGDGPVATASRIAPRRTTCPDTPPPTTPQAHLPGGIHLMSTPTPGPDFSKGGAPQGQPGWGAPQQQPYEQPGYQQQPPGYQPAPSYSGGPAGYGAPAAKRPGAVTAAAVIGVVIGGLGTL